MGRLVKTTPAAQEQQEEKRTVVGTGAHGRLVKTGDVQRTSPAANTAKTPTAQSVYQKALDEAMMKRAAADQKNKERGRKSYNRTHAQEVREITGDKTKKSITPIIKSAAAGYAADMVGAADTLLRAPSGLNYAASQERGEIEASKKNIAAYTEKLKAAKTEEERQQWQTLIDRNKRLIEINSKAAGEQVKNYQDATKGAQETLQGTYQKLRKTASDNMEKANEGLTPVGKYLNNVGVAGAQMAADAALGGGSALGPMFLRVFGGNSQEAAEAADKPGMSAAEQLDAQNRALLYGTASGAVSIATEKISNVAAPFKEAFGGGFLDKAIDGAIAKMNGNTAGRLALSFLSEGGEEVIEDLVQPALQTIYNGKRAGQNYSELDAAEILNDFLVGGALGLLGSGVEGVQKMDARLAAERAAAETQEPTASAETTAPEATAPAAQRQAEPTVEQRPVQWQNTEPVPAPTAGQQNTMPAQSVVTPESAQGMGEGNLTPTQPNAAQGAAEGKADALDAGKRVALDKYTTQENVQQVSQKINDGTLAVDAEHNIYRVNEDQHIDRRDSASVGERSVNAFQFDHPELHSYYADAAAVLQEEMSFAQKGGELIRRTSREAGDDEYIRTKRGVSERIARLLDDEGVRYDDIDRSLDAIIHNHGQENFAAAKRVELLLDDMLTNGYTDIHGQRIAPNEEYIAAKKAIPGADMSERTHEELPIYDMPEGRNGGINNAGQETRNDAAGAELADAGERGASGEANAARALSDGAAEWGERRGNGRESERIPREVRNVGGEDGNALTVQQRLAASGISQFISPREANVPNGASGDNTVTIFDEADWDQELIGAADWAKSKGVKKVTALLGVIKVEKDGKTGRIFGAFNADTGEIFVNAGSVQRSVSETIEHETAHYLAEVARRENVRTFMSDVQSRYSSEEWGKVYDAYFDRYAALTGDYAGMSESDIELYVWEEIMGDAYAEIDQYDEKASRFNREAESALSQSGQESESALHGERTLGTVEQGRETAAATERRTGPPEKYSYAGRNAENADLNALHEAERYEMQGVGAETIRQKTGWFRGADGKWRWEIDDSGTETDTKWNFLRNPDAKRYNELFEKAYLYDTATAEDLNELQILDKNLKGVRKSPLYLDEIVKHDKLFEAYPALRDVKVRFEANTGNKEGSYHHEENEFVLRTGLKLEPEKLKNTLIHEIQHAIQEQEGFARGANPGYWDEMIQRGYSRRKNDGRIERARKEYHRIFDSAPEEFKDKVRRINRARLDGDYDAAETVIDELYDSEYADLWSRLDMAEFEWRSDRGEELNAYDLYRDTAGEIEARDAAARRGLTAEERRNRKPDTGDENTVFADGGVSYSINNTRGLTIREQMKKYRAGEMTTHDEFYYGESPSSLDAAGFDGKPLVMSQKDFRKSRSEKHNVPPRAMTRLAEALSDPVLSFEVGDKIGILTKDIDGDGKPLLVGVLKNTELDGESVNRIKSAYGLDDPQAWIKNQITEGKTLRIYDSKKADSFLGEFGYKAERPKDYRSGDTISDVHENVKSPTLGDEIRRQIMGEETEPFKTGESSAKDVDTGGAASSAESVSENGGNVKPKTRFSLDEPVEETKTLVAMHNMTEEKLRRTLDIGAWPAPSIAIVKAKDGHTNYGEYSAVFPRETIDPQRSSKNKVYGGDAWTPTRSNARVEYEVDQSKARALEREIDRLSSEFAGGAFQNSSVIGAAGVNEVTELSLDDIAEHLAKYPAVQAAYLQSKGESLEPVYKKKKFDSLGNDVLRQYIDRVGMQEVARLCAEMETGGRLDESALNAAREVIVDDWAKRNARLLERRAENRDKLIAVQKNRLEDWRIEKFIRNAEAYIEQNGTSGDEVDKEATSAKMYSMIAPSGSWGDVEKTVQQWVRPRLDRMLGKPGIYNGKDPYTENGRKPFKETHWDYTAENIVRAMNNASDRGEGMWGLTGGTLTATSAPQYDSVDAIHADEERLRAESDDVHEKRLRDLDIEIDRVVDDLLRSTKAHSDSEYEERHILEDVLAEAAKGEHSPAAIKRSFAKDGYAIKDGNARSIMRLFDIAAKIPVGYFEAKPQRVVGFDEALAVVAPDDAPGDLLSEMRDAGMNVVEYRAGDDADRLDKINSIKNVRFSAEDEDGELSEQQEQSYEKTERDGKRGDYLSIPAEWKTKLERARAAATNNIKPSGFDSYDAYLDALDKQRAADRAERLRVKSRDEFKGTKALDELGVKIANSAGIYHNAEQLIANDKAAKSIQNATKRAEQRLGATRREKTIARDIANGERSMADIPRSVKKSRVLELVDYYTAQKATKTGLLQQQRIEINDALREQARELIGTEAPEINRKGLRKLFDPSKGLVLYHRTPQRIMRALFGWKQGQQINEAVFEPVYENEQERKRFINRMFDEVRTFEGADGKKSALNKDESAFAQRLKEGRTVEELVEKSGAAESIRAAAENLKNGAEMKDAAREFSLDKGSRDLARQYADWLQTQDDYAAAKNVDRTKVENAIEKYTELYDKLYAAINDFLVAHGYEPIGFIKGYAPHFQTSDANGKLESALKAIGVDLGSGVGKLPTSIAGLTKSFKPNKRYNPFFQHRRGNETDYDIVKGFETYVDYASDVLYHTDDIMRVRQMANYLRSTFAPEEMKADIDQMEAMRYAPADVKEEYLRDKKKITGDTFLSYEDLTNLMEQYTDEKYRSIEDATEFSDLVSWMDDYANKLAGKQLFEDRAMEREVGREALNGAKKLNRMFARANVAGNLSSALNQTAQLPMIATELGPKYTWRAVGDILRGKTTGMSAFRGESDFLTEKSGIDYIQSTKGEKAIEKLFSPLEKVDTLVSTIAVRGKYRMELDAGKSPKEAMKAADRWARDIMGTRSKGSVPLTFQSKNLIAQMLNMFQVEAANTFEHITQDRLGPGFKEMAAKIGEDKAIKKLASDAIAYMLLAFLLNRLDEDAYGGTPAPFDVLGMGLNAVASGNGLTSSDMLKMIADDVTENIFGERLFDTDPNDMNDEFDGWSAAEDTLYNISNDVPYVRNVAGLMGWGDQTLPMPDIVGAAGKTKDALKNADSAGEFWAEVAKQLVGLAGDTLPGGRQAEKMLQGGDAVIRGGSYQGFGDSKRLQYPVEPLLEDPFEALRAGLFGKNSLNESRAYWAAGGNALSVSQTMLYQELVDSGMSRKKAYETIRDFNDATADLEADKDENGNPVSGSKKEKVVEAINKLPLSRKQKDKLYLSKNYSEKDLGEMPWN